MQYNRLLSTLSFIICHISIIYCNELDKLDIEDYQFYFKTYSYKFPIQQTHKIIKYPLDNNINITFNINLNETISLSFNNIRLDFFNMDDFGEISYISSINPKHRHRLLSSHLTDDGDDGTDNFVHPHTKVVKGNFKDADLSQIFEKQAQDAVERAEKHKSHVGPHSKKTKRGKKSKKGKKGKKGTKGRRSQSEKDLENKVEQAIRKRALKKKKKQIAKLRGRNPWRNQMWDRNMHNGPHPGFPTLSQWRKFRRQNERINEVPNGENSEYDRYKRYQHRVVHQAGEIYDKFHNGQTDLPGHTPQALQQRYKLPKVIKGPRYKIKVKAYPPPPDMPRTVPYHHGKYIGIPDRKSWFMAQQFCREQYGTNLASVMKVAEMAEIRHVCDEVAGYGHCWIGLRRPFGTWQDGKPVMVSNWGAKGVNNLHEQPLNCVEMLQEDQVWHAQLCTVRRSFVCEIPRKRTRGKFIGIGKTLSWESAENYCQQTYNTDLASITSVAENRLAMNLCRDISSDMHHCWIGLIKPYLLWTDGTPVKGGYVNFNKHGFIPDHKGVDIHEGIGELPEPYGEDHQKSKMYPAAHMEPEPGEEGEEGMKMPLEGKRREVAEKVKSGHGVTVGVGKKKPQSNANGAGGGGKDKLEKKFIDEKDPTGKTKKHYVAETDGNRKLEKAEAKLEKKLEKKIAGEAGSIKKKADARNQCVQIDTSYKGTWDKTRCTFRHFFLCNNPAHREEDSESGESEESEEEEEHTASKYKKKLAPLAKKTKRLKAKLKEKVKHEIREEAEKKRATQFRRRLANADNEDEFLGGIMKKLKNKAMGMMKGGGGEMDPQEGIQRRHRRDQFRREREGKSRWKRREKRRRRRTRRRRRFKRWLKKHYGRGYRRRCKHCPIHHIRVRSLPKDMHWSPLSGLIPMFGVQGLHRPKKSPKIHIVAKVHLPKDRTVDAGYLDYGLLTRLLFNDDGKINKKNTAVMRQFDEREKRLENMVQPRQGQKLMAGYNAQGNFDKNEEENALYKKWDLANDQRAEKAMTARRRMMEGDGNGDGDMDGVSVVARCKVVDRYEVCMSYYVMEREISVAVKSLEGKVLRGERRRVFRDMMRMDQAHYSDYEVVDDDGEDVDGGYVLFEPLDGNLGYAIYKYELMDWHWINEYENVDELRGEKYTYGEYDNFDNYIRFGRQFEMVLHGELEYECSATLIGLPFRLCVDDGGGEGVRVFFEKDGENDVLDVSFSFRFKEFVDSEFENAVFVFAEDSHWDEINRINGNEYIEKCSYLHIAKICMKEKIYDHSMTASISFQLMSKQVISEQNFKKIGKMN